MFFTAFDKKGLESEIENLKKLSLSDGFWNDPKKAGSVLKQQNYLEGQISKRKNFADRFELVKFMADEIKNEPEFSESFENEVLSLFGETLKFKIETLLGGKYDSGGAIIAIQAGAGGTDSCDFAEILFRMYGQYASKNNFKLTVLNSDDAEEAGIKSITFLIEGQNAYGYLKNESGVHRLVRISPFDSAKRRHTSFASVEVSPHIDNEINVEINKDDVKIDTFKSGGAGGQHVNKTESAIRLTHLPSGIVVVCQSERSSHQNKELALSILHSKLIAEEERKRQEEKDAKNSLLKKIEWGSQIRSYVFCPYTMVKDHRTGFETSDVNSVLNGDLAAFIEEMIKAQGSLE